MLFLRRHAFWVVLIVFVAGLVVGAPAPTMARTRVADGFDLPVGKPDGDGYYKSRGFRANYHMGEDWNGVEGGNRDLGKPVYSTAHGLVVFARDMRMSWGNLVIIRHVFVDEGKMRTIDSVYAHMDRILVKEGQQVVRGQQVGTIGTAHGLYPAHLHFEIRKNLAIGYNQRGYPKDLNSYYLPTNFILSHRKLPGGGRSALVPTGTFDLRGVVSYGNNSASEATPANRPAFISPKAVEVPQPTPDGAKRFRVNRFDDLLSF